LWFVDALGHAVEDLTRAIEAGKDTQMAQPEAD